MTASSWLFTSVPQYETSRAIEGRHRAEVPFALVNKNLRKFSHPTDGHLGRRPSIPLPVDSNVQLLRVGQTTLCT